MERRWEPVEKSDVPDYSKDNLNICREALMEAVAETSEEFMERYFNGEEFSEDEIRQATPCECGDGSIVPVLWVPTHWQEECILACRYCEVSAKSGKTFLYRYQCQDE